MTICFLVFIPLHSFALNGTQRADLSNPRLVNAFGEALSQNINTNQQIQVTADVNNKQSSPQNFVYLVQILNKDGVVLKLTWISATLNPQQTLSPAISWSTATPGTYTAEIYVWNSITDASALTASSQLKIIVS
ncbi:MAG TPA: hypothetical protein VFM64_01535 [Candidatus Nitrosotenuis sp.]|nr:hypothetical protein [Candidatus Nitrosotenuis sp.]